MSAAEDPKAWALEQYCVAVTSILLGGVILKALDAEWKSRPLPDVLFIVGFILILAVNQVGYLHSVKKTPYRYVALRPLVDLAMVGLYNQVVLDWQGSRPAWAWLLALLFSFVVWDLCKMAEKGRGGVYRKDAVALRADAGRTRITAFAFALAVASWAVHAAMPAGVRSALPGQPYFLELLLLGILALFWVAKALPEAQREKGGAPSATP